MLQNDIILTISKYLNIKFKLRLRQTKKFFCEKILNLNNCSKWTSKIIHGIHKSLANREYLHLRDTRIIAIGRDNIYSGFIYFYYKANEPDYIFLNK